MTDLEAIHGHEGQTRIVWTDEAPEERQARVNRLWKRANACPPSEGTDCALAAISSLGPVPTEPERPVTDWTEAVLHKT